MTPLRARLDALCATLPGTGKSGPWGGGQDAWTVGARMFACIGAMTPGVAVKTPDIETAAMRVDAGIGARAPYVHRSRVLLPEATPDDELTRRVTPSYDIVRAGLPRKVRTALPDREAS